MRLSLLLLLIGCLACQSETKEVASTTVETAPTSSNPSSLNEPKAYIPDGTPTVKMVNMEILETLAQLDPDKVHVYTFWVPNDTLSEQEVQEHARQLSNDQVIHHSVALITPALRKLPYGKYGAWQLPEPWYQIEKQQDDYQRIFLGEEWDGSVPMTMIYKPSIGYKNAIQGSLPAPEIQAIISGL